MFGTPSSYSTEPLARRIPSGDRLFITAGYDVVSAAAPQVAVCGDGPIYETRGTSAPLISPGAVQTSGRARIPCHPATRHRTGPSGDGCLTVDLTITCVLRVDGAVPGFVSADLAGTRS